MCLFPLQVLSLRTPPTHTRPLLHALVYVHWGQMSSFRLRRGHSCIDTCSNASVFLLTVQTQACTLCVCERERKRSRLGPLKRRQKSLHHFFYVPDIAPLWDNHNKPLPRLSSSSSARKSPLGCERGKWRFPSLSMYVHVLWSLPASVSMGRA